MKPASQVLLSGPILTAERQCYFAQFLRFSVQNQAKSHFLKLLHTRALHLDLLCTIQIGKDGSVF